MRSFVHRQKTSCLDTIHRVICAAGTGVEKAVKTIGNAMDCGIEERKCEVCGRCFKNKHYKGEKQTRCPACRCKKASGNLREKKIRTIEDNRKKKLVDVSMSV
ncbi:hypothetical protein BaRGS_00025974 [Batillaria attramentaria]|uniref:Uncharacterized protein n=1 Tax=Batillaria attramentaria TaxID=370345 RepID=A0ABD0K6Q9_9CAEN